MIKVGDVLHFHDSVTGFSGEDRVRWCVVTVVIGGYIRVAGRSTTRTDGVPPPAPAMPEKCRYSWPLWTCPHLGAIPLHV